MVCSQPGYTDIGNQAFLAQCRGLRIGTGRVNVGTVESGLWNNVGQALRFSMAPGHSISVMPQSGCYWVSARFVISAQRRKID